MNLKTALTTFSMAFIVTGCSYVELKPEASHVKTLTLEEVTYCKPTGTVTSTVASEVMRVYRDEKTVAKELEILAKNEADKLGGNAIAPITEIEDGTRTFRVYHCPGN